MKPNKELRVRLITKDMLVGCARVGVIIGLIFFALSFLILWLNADRGDGLVQFYTNRHGEQLIEIIMFTVFILAGLVMLGQEFRRVYTATKVYSIERYEPERIREEAIKWVKHLFIQ